MRADFTYVGFNEDAKVRVVYAESPAGEEPETVEVEAGHSIRGWLLRVGQTEIVFMSGGGDTYLIPRDAVGLTVHARNPQAAGLTAPPRGSWEYEGGLRAGGPPVPGVDRRCEPERGMTLYLRRAGRVVVDDTGVAVDDELLDPSRLLACAEYRSEVVERLALLEQYAFVLKAGDNTGLVTGLERRLAASDDRLDGLVARGRVADQNPADEAVQEVLIEAVRRQRRDDREWSRNPPAPIPLPVAATLDRTAQVEFPE